MEFPRFESGAHPALREWFARVELRLECRNANVGAADAPERQQQADEAGAGRMRDARVVRAHSIARYVRVEAAHLVEDVLENVTVDLFLSVLALLLHRQAALRRAAVLSLLELAIILAPKRGSALDKGALLGSVCSKLGSGLSAQVGVRMLFQAIGRCLAPICRVVVASSEALLVHTDVELRQLSVTVVASMALANDHLFEQQELVQIVWEMFMQLDAGTSGNDVEGVPSYVTHQHAQQRVAVLAAVQQLMNAVVAEDEAFAVQLISLVLRMRTSTEEENQAKTRHACQLAEVLMHHGMEADLYSVFLSVLGSSQEHTLRDLFVPVMKAVRSSPQSAKSKVAVKAFLRGVERFLLAPQPLMRYGALVSVHGVLSSFPLELLNMLESSLFPLLLCACLDPCHACMELGIFCVKLILSKQSRLKRTSVSSINSVEEEPLPKTVLREIKRIETHVLTGRSSAHGSSPASTHRFSVQVQRMVSMALPLCGQVEESTFVRLSSGLQNLPRSERVHRMHVLLLWAKRVRHSIPLLVNNLLIGIREPEPVTGALAVRIFSSLSPALGKALKDRNPNEDIRTNVCFRSICAIETVYRQVLARGANDDLAARVIETFHEIPFEFFDESRLAALQMLLSEHCFSAAPAVRHNAYRALGGCLRLWRTPGLKVKAAAALFLCLGESTVQGVRILIAALTNILAECGLQNAVDTIEEQSEGLVELESEPRMRSLSAIIALLAKPEMQALRAELMADGLLMAACRRFGLVVSPQSPPASPMSAAATTSSSSSSSSAAAAAATAAAPAKGDAAAIEPTEELEHKEEGGSADGGLVASTEDKGAEAQRLLSTGAVSGAGTSTADKAGQSPGAMAGSSQPPYFVAMATAKLVAPTKRFEPRIWAAQLLARMLALPAESAQEDAQWALVHVFVTLDGTVCAPSLRWFIEHAYDVLHSPSPEQIKARKVCEILAVLVRMAIPGLNRTVLIFFSEAVLRHLENTETEPLVRQAGMKLMLELCSQRPLGSTVILPQLKDILRKAFSSRHQCLIEAASQAYPHIVRLGSTEREEAEALFDFLVADLAPLRVEGEDWRASSDPLIAELGPAQLKHVLHATVHALGEVQHEALAPKCVDVLLDVLHNHDAALRRVALRSILQLSKKLPAEQAAAARWVTLPLLADPAPSVSKVFKHAWAGLPLDESEHLALRNPDPDDVEEQALHMCDTSNVAMRDCSFFRDTALGDFVIERLLNGLGASATEDDDAAQPPVRPEVSEDLLVQLHKAAEGFCGPLGPEHADLVDYHMHEFMHHAGLNGAAALVLSEVARAILRRNSGVKAEIFMPEGSNALAGLSTEVAQAREKVRGILTALFLCVGVDETVEQQQQQQESQDELGEELDDEERRREADQQLLGRLDRALIQGSAIGLENIAAAAPSHVLPLVLNDVCAVESLKLGHLWTLKRLFGLFLGNEMQLRTLVPQDRAQKLADLLLKCIKTDAQRVDHKKAALDLIGEIALLAGPQELKNVITCIIDTLQENSDAAIHAMSQQQLSLVFAGFDAQHPLVESLIKHVNTGFQSSSPKTRQRSFTLLSIVAKPMGAARATPGFIRALADPNKRLRLEAIKLILSQPPAFIKEHEGFRASLRKLANAIGLEAKQPPKGSGVEIRLAHRRRQTQNSAAGDRAAALDPGAHSAADDSVVSFPLSDDDPLNVTFLKGDLQFKALLEQYGMDSARFIERQLAMARLNSDSSGRRRDAPAIVESPFGISERASAALLTSDPVAIIRCLLGIDERAGEHLMQAMEQDIVSARELFQGCLEDLPPLMESGSGAALGDSLDPFAQEKPFSSRELFLEELQLKFSVHGTVLKACDALGPDAAKRLIPGMQALVEKCVESTRRFRLHVAKKMNQVAVMSPDLFDLPFVSVDQFAEYERHRSMMLGAGMASKNHEGLMRTMQAVHDQLYVFNSHLWMITRLHQTLLEAIGTMYMLVTDLEKATLVIGYEWLLRQLVEDDNRSLRQTTRTAVVGMSQTPLRSDDFRKYVADSLPKVKATLDSNTPNNISAETRLYRTKLDVMSLLVQLLPLSNSPELLKETAATLVLFWDDPDSYVRQTSIQLIETLGESGYPGIRRLLFPPENRASVVGGGGRGRASMVATPQAGPSVNLREEISKRLNDAAYTDKDCLNRLLQWSTRAD